MERSAPAEAKPGETVVGEARNRQQQHTRCVHFASGLLWSRPAELEDLQYQLVRLGDLVAEVVLMRGDIVVRVDNEMSCVLACATTAQEGDSASPTRLLWSLMKLSTFCRCER
jgi:hypothetical protein